MKSQGCSYLSRERAVAEWPELAGLSLAVAPGSSPDNSMDGSSSSACLKMLVSRIHCLSE